jgi:CRISPR system Cascade subunit CasD
MSVLLLRLAGPMQSWGTQSRFTHRDTGLEPSRSGAIGLLCAALGRTRDQPLDDFAPLAMAVRVDREGRLMRDYHTVENCRKADGTMPQWSKRFVETERFYLADAEFLVGLEGDRAFLDRLAAALDHPVWPLCLGRKAFVPALPVGAGVRDGDLRTVLAGEPWRKRVAGDKAPAGPLRGVVEVAFGAGEPRQDVPISFVSRDRRFRVRHVQHTEFPLPTILEPDAESPDVPQPLIAERPLARGPA